MVMALDWSMIQFKGFAVYNVTGSRSQAINFNKKDLVNEFMESQSADQLIDVNVTDDEVCSNVIVGEDESAGAAQEQQTTNQEVNEESAGQVEVDEEGFRRSSCIISNVTI